MAFDAVGRLLVNEASGGESSYAVNPDATLLARLWRGQTSWPVAAWL